MAGGSSYSNKSKEKREFHPFKIKYFTEFVKCFDVS